MTSLKALLILLLITLPAFPFTLTDHSLRDLESSTQAEFDQEASFWTLSSSWSGINTYTTKADGSFPARLILGGSQVLGPANSAATNQYFERIYTGLPAHSFVQLTAVFWFFDWYWGTMKPFNFYFDGTLVASPTVEPVYDSKKIFGGNADNLNPGQDLGFDHIYIGAAHTGSTLTFRVINKGLLEFKTQSFGFREISMIFSNYAGSVTPCHVSEANPALKNDQCPCSLGMGPNSGGTCVSCATNCEICSGANPDQCLKCVDGAAFNGNGCAYPGGSGPVETSLDEAKIGKTIGTIGSNAMRVMTVLKSRSPGFLSIIGLSEIIQYVRYLKINYPVKLRQFFYELNTDFLSLPIEIPLDFYHDFPKRELPDVFSEYEVDSSFLVNYWDTLISLVITGGVALAFILMKYFTKESHHRVNQVVVKVLEVMKWNLPLMYFCGSIGDIGFFGILDLRTVKFDSASAIVSFIFSIFALLFVVFAVIESLMIALNFKKKTFPGFEILYEGCKDDSTARLLYITALFTRDFACNVVIAGGDKAPLFQAAFLLLSSVIMCGYCVVIRPLKELQELVVTLVNELLLLIVNICVFILAVYDALEYENEESREKFGEVIIKISLIFGFTALVFMGVQGVLILIDVYQTVQGYRAKGVKSILGIIKAAVQDFFSSGKGGEEKSQKEAVKSDDIMAAAAAVKEQVIMINQPPEIVDLGGEVSGTVESPSPSPLKKVKIRRSRVVPHRSSLQMTEASANLELSGQRLMENSRGSLRSIQIVSHQGNRASQGNKILSLNNSNLYLEGRFS